MSAEVTRHSGVRTHVVITNADQEVTFKLWERGSVAVSVNGGESVVFFPSDLRVLLETMRDIMIS